MIAKGTIVRVTTSNGGEITGPLLEKYRPTYDVVVAHPSWGYVGIAAYRIKTIEIVA
jgi:hypothetical protein